MRELPPAAQHAVSRLNLSLTAKNAEKISEALERLSQSFNQMRPSRTNGAVVDFFRLRIAFLSETLFGSFESAFRARAMYLDFVLRQTRNPAWKELTAIAMFEEGRFEDLASTHWGLPRIDTFKTRHLRRIADSIINRDFSWKERGTRHNISSQSNFHIIGPQSDFSRAQKFGGEARYNVIFNPRSLSNLFNPNTNIAYFSKEKLTRHWQSIRTMAPELHSIRVQKLEDFPLIGIARPQNVFETFPDQIAKSSGFTTHMGVQRAIIDLLSFKPRKIFVSEIDLFGTELDAYSASYLDSPLESSAAEISRGLRFHEPFSNYFLIFNLWNRGLLTADRKLESVLASGPEKYSQTLEAKYGKHYIF